MPEQAHMQTTLDMDSETIVPELQYKLYLTDRQREALQYWVGEIERETRFGEADVMAACRVLHGLGLDPAWAIASLRAIAAYAHAHDRPLDATAEQIGMVMSLTDMYPGELSGLLDLAEEVAE